MKYQRRSDINSVKRIEMAIQAFIGKGKYGEIMAVSFSQMKHLIEIIKYKSNCNLLI